MRKDLVLSFAYRDLRLRVIAYDDAYLLIISLLADGREIVRKEFIDPLSILGYLTETYLRNRLSYTYLV
jgi:hypothetical protein